MPQNAPDCPIVQNRLNEIPAGDVERGVSLNEKQQAALELLLLGNNPSEVARQLQIDRKTLYRWRQDEDFHRELHRRRTELWSSAADRLRAMLQPALDVLEQQLGATYDRSRFRAAATILRLGNLRKATPVEEA